MAAIRPTNAVTTTTTTTTTVTTTAVTTAAVAEPAPAGTGWTDQAALDAVAARLRLAVEREILDGGSAARVYRARAEDGTHLAVKVLVERPGRVDGHDLDSFLGKLPQVAGARAGDPRLAARYLPILHALQGEGWAAYTTPFYSSVDSAAGLRAPGGVGWFLDRYATVATDLVVHGYGQRLVPAPPGYLAEVLAGRVSRRFGLLARHLPAGLLDAPGLVVNDVPCRPPGPLLARLAEERPGWWRRLAPPRLGFPAHGDANTRNVLVPAHPGVPEFRLIDPRGSTAAWDPVYDLAKTLFSLTVWDPALRLGCAVRPVAGHPAQVVAGFRTPVYPGYRAAAHRFLPHLATLPDLAGFFDGDPCWRERLVLTHGLHVLAEAACRLSDRKPRRDPAGRPIRPEELALGHYLLGALLLEDLVRQLSGGGELDLDRHLGLVTGAPPAG